MAPNATPQPIAAPSKDTDTSNISVVDLFSIGIGPSSSHTIGPMRAGYRFCENLQSRSLIEKTARIQADLFGSLALTGIGHATDKATLLGLSGQEPQSADPEAVDTVVDAIRADKILKVMGTHAIAFDPDQDLIFNFETFLPEHPNGMRFKAFDAEGNVMLEEEFFSVGGGFILAKDELDGDEIKKDNIELPYAFHSAEELLEIGQRTGLSIADIMLSNEGAWRSDGETRDFLFRIRDVMFGCIDRGCKKDGILPGGLKVRRRAKDMYQELTSRPEAVFKDPLVVMDWVNLYALAVNEENAAGGQVVTAPTNGAAGVIPAVLKFYTTFCHNADDEGVAQFLLTAAAMGVLYKKRASISAAEVGCQGEVGVACSMAAGALCAVLGGTNEQVENAAEIGMEHNLGLTCDPVGGLVQVPCIERNTMGAVKAINAARLALRGDGEHLVSLDKVIQTMWETGVDMQSKYKETSQGGLAVNVVEC